VFILTNKFGIQATQFDASVIGRELPVDVGSTKIAVALPCGDLVRQALPVVDPTSQALPPEYAQFTFRDVQPASMFWRVMNLQTFRQSPGFARNKRLVERRGRMGIQVVHFHPPDELAVVFFRKTPLLFQPRLNCIFFSVLRTVSGLMDGTTSNSTSLSASIRNVHRARPWGTIHPSA
jgi:hypothetical protein